MSPIGSLISSPITFAPLLPEDYVQHERHRQNYHAEHQRPLVPRQVLLFRSLSQRIDQAFQVALFTRSGQEADHNRHQQAGRESEDSRPEILRHLARVSMHSRQPSAFRSEEHTSELQSRGLISYAVFCLKKKTKHLHTTTLSFRATLASV